MPAPKDDKKGFYERICTPVWNQYEYKARSIERIEKKLEILLAISGILATFLLSMLVSNAYKNIFIIISILGLVSVFVLSFYEFIIPHKKRWVPYIEEHDMKKYAERDDIEGFFAKFVDECYRTTGEANKAAYDRIKLIRKNTFILLVSLYLPIAYEIYTNYTLFLSGSIVIFAIILIVFYRAFKGAMKGLV